MHAHGEWHADIHPDVPRVRNTGFLLDGRVFGPGDAYSGPHTAVDLLFVPEFGLYTKFGYAIDFIRQVKPKQASPRHDTGLDAQGIAGADTTIRTRHRFPVRPTAQRNTDHHLSQNLRPIENPHRGGYA